MITRTQPCLHGSDDPNAQRVLLRWRDTKTNVVHEKTAAVGSTLLEAAHRSDIDLEGACEGSVACSTCHVILEPDVFDALEEASEDEDDMLDSAFGLRET
jgi:ferredoxin